MNKKFVLSLAIFSVLLSCRESEEIMDSDKTNTNKETVSRKHLGDESNTLGDSSKVAKDSAKSSATLEEDPPIKYGGHWKQ